MPSLARTISLSQVFDYEAYENDTRDDTSANNEKLLVLQGQDLDDAASWDLDVGPLHDVHNLVAHNGVAPAPTGAEQPASPLRALFYDDEESMPPTGIRRESTLEVLDSSSLLTAGPSRTASQTRTWWALQRMDSSFGSEFGGSDAVVYGGSERDEGSVLSEDEDEEGGPEPEDCVFTLHDDHDDHDGSGGTEDGLSGAEAFEEEGPEDDAESQGDDSSDEGVAWDEATEDTPQDVPPPSSLVAGPSSGLRRSTRVRNRPAPFAPPPQRSPKKDKGKGKAVAREARNPAPSKRTSTKRARSPSPSPSDLSDDSADAPTRAPKKPRLTAEETQAMWVIPAGMPREFPCAVAGCEDMCSLDNVAALSKHFGDEHYSAAEKKLPGVPCRWGVGCPEVRSYSEVVRHLKKDHLGLTARCDRCESTFIRPDEVKRHQETGACGRKTGSGSRSGSGSSTKGKGRRK